MRSFERWQRRKWLQENALENFVSHLIRVGRLQVTDVVHHEKDDTVP